MAPTAPASSRARPAAATTSPTPVKTLRRREERSPWHREPKNPARLGFVGPGPGATLTTFRALGTAMLHVDRFERLVRSLPLVAHWLDGEPLEEQVVTMSKIEDRWRSLVVNGEPVVTGLVSAGDAWACSNPSLGRGVSIGMLQGRLLRDTLRSVDPGDPYGLAVAFHRGTAEKIEPWFMWTRFEDRHRLAEIDALIAGEEYHPGDQQWEIEQALAGAVMKDNDLLRIFVRAALILDPLDQALARPGVTERVMELGHAWRDEPVMAPRREELVAIANG